MRGEPRRGGTSLTILDLYDTGYAETASLDAPSVVHVSHGQGVVPRIKPVTISDVESLVAVAGEGNAVVALSPLAARLVSAEALKTVAAKSATLSDPCRFRDELLRINGERAPMLPAPPIAVCTRPFGR